MMIGLPKVPSYHPQKTPDRPGRAIVVGAGIAGVLTARVLAEHFERVTLVDRDEPPLEPTPRKGVPQGHQPHLLLRSGQTIIETLIPGFTESLYDAGALRIDWNDDLQYWEAGGLIASGDSEFPLVAASRPLIEHVLRNAVLEISNVRFQQTHLLDGFSLENNAVNGICTADGELEAELVIDATGRTSRTPQWLSEHGFDRPLVDEVQIDVAYSTIQVARPPNDTRMMFAPPSPPRKLGGGVFPIEDERWIITIQGMHDATLPETPDGFQSVLEELPIDAFDEMLNEHQPLVEEADIYPFPASRWHRYEQVERFPAGLLVTGDAVATFNPIYGQGMSVSAMQAMVMHETLRTTEGVSIGPRYFERVASVISQAWRLAVGNDFRFDETTGSRPRGTTIMNRYLERLLQRAHTDGHLAEAFARVAMMERPMSDLVHPSMVWRVFAPEVLNSE